MLSKLKNQKGFTLIEVVIVLAIAALIILVVLQAVAAAQQAQRDTARKQEGGRVAAILEQIASNKDGVYPTVANVDADITSYDPALGGKYIISSAACPASTPPGVYTMQYTLTNQYKYVLKVCLEKGKEQAVTK